MKWILGKLERVRVGGICVLRGLSYESINPTLKPGAVMGNPDSTGTLPWHQPGVPCSPGGGVTTWSLQRQQEGIKAVPRQEAFDSQLWNLEALVSPFHTSRRTEIAMHILLASQDPWKHQGRPPAWKTIYPARCFSETPSRPCISSLPLFLWTGMRTFCAFLRTCTLPTVSQSVAQAAHSSITWGFPKRGLVQDVIGYNADLLNWDP